MGHSWIRKAAHAVVFGGWMLPLVLAELVPAHAGTAAAEAARAFKLVGGGWAFLAVSYGIVLAMRMRRGIAD